MITALKNIAIANHFLYSLVAHAAILSFLLTLPVYSGRAAGDSLRWYFVHLKKEGPGKPEKVLQAPQAEKLTDSGITGDTKNQKTSRVSVEDTQFAEEKIKSSEKRIQEEPARVDREGRPSREDIAQAADTTPEPTVEAGQREEVRPGPRADTTTNSGPGDEGASLIVPDKVESEKEMAPPTLQRKASPKTTAIPAPPQEEIRTAVATDASEASKKEEKKTDSLTDEDRPLNPDGTAKDKSAVVPPKAIKEKAVAQEKTLSRHPGLKADHGEITSDARHPVKRIPQQTDMAKVQTSGVAARTEAIKKTFEEEQPAVKTDINAPGEAPPADEKKNKATGKVPLNRKESENKGEKPIMGIPVPQALIAKDVKIEVIGRNGDILGLIMRLLKRSYPTADGKNSGEKQKKVEVAEEKGATNGNGTARLKTVFAIAHAEKGIYTLIMENKAGRTCEVDVIFRLYEGGEKEKIKEYSAVKLLPDTTVKLRFVIPDMIFWDDDNIFSGVIEDSRSITKFKYDSGLIWKEDKDY